MVTKQLTNEDNVVQEFTDWLKSKARSDNTLVAYSADIRNLVQYIEIGGVQLDDINGEMVIDSILSSKNAEKGISQSTMRRKINSAATFVKFLKVSGLDVEPLKPSKLEKIAFSRATDNGIGLRDINNSYVVDDNKFDKLIEAISCKRYYFSPFDYYRARDVLLANLFYRAGAKSEEAINLKIGDMIHLGETKFLVTLGKKKRKVEFVDANEGGAYPVVAYRDYLAEFMGIKDEIEIDPETPAVLNKREGAISSRSVRRYFSVYGMEVFGRPISPRDLRTSHRDYLLNSGEPVEEIARRLGISPINVTKRDYPLRERN